MTNWKNEIDAAAKKMVGEMKKAGFSAEKIELNKKILDQVVESLKSDLDKHTNGDLIARSITSAKSYTANVYGMTGKFAAHGSQKHAVAHSLAKLM